jgi:serralysin
MADASAHIPLLNPNLSNGEFVANLYNVAFQRAPDSTGRDYQLNLLNKGVARETIISNVLVSSEYDLKAPTNTDFINNLYHDLLGRDADAGGLTFWTKQLSTGASRDFVIRAFVDSSEFSSENRHAVSIDGLTYTGKDGFNLPFKMAVLKDGAKASAISFDASKLVVKDIADGRVTFNSNVDYIDPSKPTFVYTHGWTDNGKTDNSADASFKSKLIYNTFIQKYGSNANVIIVDWQNLAANRDSTQGSKEPTYESTITKQVGEVVADALIRTGVDLNKTTLIGHSLGSFVMGAAANQIFSSTGTKVGELVALDTAAGNPFFPEYDIDARNGINRGAKDSPYDFTTSIAQKTTSFTVMDSDGWVVSDSSSQASNSTRAATAQNAYLVGYVPQVDPNLAGKNGPAEVSNYHNGVVSAYADLVSKGNLDASAIITKSVAYESDGDIDLSGKFDGIIATNQPWIGNASDPVAGTGTSFRPAATIGWVYNDASNPQLYGTSSNDTLFFSRFYNSVRGVQIFGGAGNDLIGGDGNIDRYTGGAGADTFYFSYLKNAKSVNTYLDGESSSGDMHAVLMDFNAKEDFIQLGQKSDQVKYELASKFSNGIFNKDFDKNGSDGVVIYSTAAGKNDVFAYVLDATVAQIDDAVANGHIIFNKTVNLDQLLFLS